MRFNVLTLVLLIFYATSVSAASSENLYKHPYKAVQKCCREIADINTVQILKISDGKVTGALVMEELTEDPKDGVSIPFKGTLKNNDFAFKTSVGNYNGVKTYYSFKGRFTHTPPFGSLMESETPVLEGELNTYIIKTGESQTFAANQLSQSAPLKLAAYETDD